MANAPIRKEDEGPMATMGPSDEIRTAIEALGVLKAFRVSATFARGAEAAQLLKFCDQRLWSKAGFSSQTAFLEFMRFSKQELSDLRQQLGAFGEELMTRMDEAGVPRKARRVLTHVDRRELIDIKKQLEAAPDADTLHDLAADLYNRIAEAEKDKTAATENAKNWERKATDHAATAKDAKKKVADLERQLAAAQQGLPRDVRYVELYGRAFRALTLWKNHIRTEGLREDEEKLFDENFAAIHGVLDEVVAIHNQTPLFGESRQRFIRRYVKEEEATREEAEQVADGHYGPPADDK